MTTDSVPDHIQKPHLRPIQPLSVKDNEGKQMVALRDPLMLNEQTMIVPPQVVQILQHFRGQDTIEDIAGRMNGNVDQFTDLVKRLDQIGLLWGPTFEKLETAAKEALRQRGNFTAKASKSLGEDEHACRASMRSYLEQTDDPEIEGTVVGIVAPHLDYDRGWPNYAASYFTLQDLEPPDRIVILGTNHFGLGDGVVLTEFGFETPLGIARADTDVIKPLVNKLGNEVIIDQLDHNPEHSIELQIPWLQYTFGDIPLVAALIPDPFSQTVEEDDTRRIDADSFTDVLGDVLDSVGGRTLFVASSDLSHVGPQFGEPRAIDEQRRIDVERHDRDMMAKFLAADTEEFLSAFKWNRNPTRWCSIGNMCSILKLSKPSTLELLDYRQAYDEKGMALVSSAAIALLG